MTTGKDYNPTYWQYFTTFPGEEWFTLVQKILHLLNHNPSIWDRKHHWYTMWSVQNWLFWTLIYIWLYLPVISNVRLTLFSCLRENHSTLHEVLFTISTVTEQPVVCLVELHGQCGIDPHVLGPYSSTEKRDTFFTDNWIRNFITKCCLSWQTSRWDPCS